MLPTNLIIVVPLYAFIDTTRGIMEDVYKKRLLMKQIVLRETTHTAMNHYCCWDCDQGIFPGDRYDKSVVVQKGPGLSALIVKRYHNFPQCEIPPDDPYDEKSSEEVSNVIPFKLAA